MRSMLTCMAAGGALLASAVLNAGSIQINEIRIDQTGTDTDEYFELIGPPNDLLVGLTYIVIGDGATASGTIEAVVDLTGQTLDANGLFVAAEATISLGTANLTASLNFENSDNVTHLLVDGFTGADGDDLDTNDDGTLDVTPWTSVVDAVALIIADPPEVGQEFVYAVQLGGQNVGPDGTFVPGHVYRCTPDGDWVIGPFDPTGGDDTPGAANEACPTGPVVNLFVTKDAPPNAISGTQFDYILTVTNSGLDPAFDVTVTDDLPAGVTFIGQVSSPPIAFTGVPPNLSWDAGDLLASASIEITVTVQVDAESGDLVNTVDVGTTSREDDPQDNSDTVTTSVAGALPEGLVINELLADPDAKRGDANGDGTVDTSNDEFVEIVNGGGAPADLSGIAIADLVAVRHVFPAGTILDPGCAIIVFGGGAPTGSFGGAQVQVASEGFLGLNNTGDTVTVGIDEAVAAQIVYGAEGGDNQSLTRDPDIIGPDALVQHSTATGSGGTLFSPGTRIDGTPFDCGKAPPCLADLFPVNDIGICGDGDGDVGAGDLGELLASWGICVDCCADLFPVGVGDDAVGAGDLGELLANWGQCP